MRLLLRSVLRHLKEHLLQTILTMAVTILTTGMLAVLFHLASSFQGPLRTHGLERYGTYHYDYYTNAGTGVAKAYAEMAKRFRQDDWFSDVKLTEDGSRCIYFSPWHIPDFSLPKPWSKNMLPPWKTAMRQIRARLLFPEPTTIMIFWLPTVICQRKTESIPICLSFFCSWQPFPLQPF